MRNDPLGVITAPLRQAPKELVAVVGLAAAVFAVVTLGGLIASALPIKPHTEWMVFASYAAPAAVAFVVYWWAAQRH